MKKMIRKTVLILTSAALIAGMGLGVYASDEKAAPELYIDAYSVGDEDINIYVNQNQGDPSWIENGDPQLMFGSKDLAYESVKKFSDAPEKITYKCVIDVSGSMDQKRIDEAKEIINSLVAAKRDEDNVTITAMGNDLIRSDYMTDRSQISGIVSQVSRTREDTNLYYGIVDEIKELQTNDNVANKKCLIIFSDGADDQATGITREEATKKVEESHIPVFTVALPKNSSSKNDQEMAKILGSFARLSSGGVHYYSPDYKKEDLPSVGNMIVNRMNNSLIFNVDIRELDTDEKAHELKISVKTSEGTAKDVIDVAESDIKRIKENIEKLVVEPVVETKPAVQQVPVEKKEKKLIFGLEPLYFYLIVAGAALLIILIVILIILKTGSSGREEQNGGTDDLGNTVGVDDIGVTGGVSDLNGVTLPVDNLGSPTVGFDTPSSGKSYHMTLTRMGKSDDAKNTFKFDLKDRYSVGRSASKSQLSFPDDTAMSGLHCTFYVQDKKIYVKDEGSTNGTFVNGVPITGPYALEKDDTLIIGSNEYRVTWG